MQIHANPKAASCKHTYSRKDSTLRACKSGWVAGESMKDVLALEAPPVLLVLLLLLAPFQVDVDDDDRDDASGDADWCSLFLAEDRDDPADMLQNVSAL